MGCLFGLFLGLFLGARDISYSNQYPLRVTHTVENRRIPVAVEVVAIDGSSNTATYICQTEKIDLDVA